MKMAYQYCRQSGCSQKRKFLVFERSYHGDTCGAMSVSRDGDFNRNYKDLLFEVIRCRQGTSSADPASVWTEDFLAQLDRHAGEICAVLLEPLIQGAGGMIVWPSAAVRFICEEARRRGVLVIFDEVMTGFGRTGSLFAFEQIDFTPDLLCLSKGLTGGFLPMGLTVASADVFAAFLSDSPEKMLFHGHSFTGNALSCAAAVANLEIWRREPNAERLRAINIAHHAALERPPAGLPIKERRVCGTLGVVELDLPAAYGGAFSRQLFSKCLEQGIFLRTLGSTIYLMPPYCATACEVQAAWQTVFSAAANS
jgi:adenosylmethionine-8-amino-7-oxononanoate aminotransferase